ncbi:Small nuclear ribonucleoprotein-associated protein B [Penicillium crustosum]|uniref:Small nuclear ribonucleoprotein-associated protein B n=1 Tax=Penicillium crustosum TaxID=36656 RepID=UPI00238EDFC9|nr:Small nuclear ribonucleoprotein-associated protein B [Penicillium crustosum]KAJ5412130.1 Small nuclear ribonucleoprotein-associated protein B [Penicillium crustosum]
MASHKMQNLINYRMRVTLNDGRQMTGSMLAFDKHMNLVLADTEEFRRIKRKSKPAAGPTNAPLVEAEEKRSLGLTIVRGTQVVSCSVEGPPPADPSARLGTTGPGAAATLAAGPGISKPAGRGLPIGLGGPAAGVGGPPPPGGFGFPLEVSQVPLLPASLDVEAPRWTSWFCASSWICSSGWPSCRFPTSSWLPASWPGTRIPSSWIWWQVIGNGAQRIILCFKLSAI